MGRFWAAKLSLWWMAGHTPRCHRSYFRGDDSCRRTLLTGRTAYPGKAVATNAPPAWRQVSGLRGAAKPVCDGAAHGSHRAATVGALPVEIRRRNFLKPGMTTTTGQTIREPIDLDQLLERGLELSDYRAKKERFEKENQRGTRRKGMGIAAFLHGAGFTGSGERYLGSVVGVEGCADGRVRVLVSSTEFGQGTKTVLCQIAAEALGLTYEDVQLRSQIPMKCRTVGRR